MSQKSYDNKPTLYLIPTPIGNLDDITLRAIKILKEVEVVFSEDTRVTKLLLDHLKIKKKLISNHEHNEEENGKRLLSYLDNGYNVGLVSDRGTPIISDPGYYLSRISIENNYNVVSLPGATALIPALTSSGISPLPFMFYGFLNHNSSKKRKELEKLKTIEATLIFYESPHRLINTLDLMKELMGNRLISISREISKKYEEIYRGTIEEVKKQLENIKGEIVIVVEGNKEIPNYNLTILEHINLYIKMGNTPNEAIKIVAKERNIPKNIIYSEYHKK